MIIRGIKNDDFVVRGNSNTPKKCRVHAKSLIELQKNLKEMNLQKQNSQHEQLQNETNQVPDIKQIQRQFSHMFIKKQQKQRSSSSYRIKTDDGTFNSSSQQSTSLNKQFIPFVNERDQLGRLLTDNYDPEDDQTVFTYRPVSQRKHAKSIDGARMKTLPSQIGLNEEFNKNGFGKQKTNIVYEENQVEEIAMKRKLEDMIRNYSLENKILLGINKQSKHEVQDQDSFNQTQTVTYRLNIKHQEDLKKKQDIANNLTFARGFYKRAQADESYKRVKANKSNFNMQQNQSMNENKLETNDFPTRLQKNKNYYLNIRRNLSSTLKDQLDIFRQRSQQINKSPIPPLGHYDQTKQENFKLKQKPKVVAFNIQEKFFNDKKVDDQSNQNSLKKQSPIMKKYNDNSPTQSLNNNQNISSSNKKVENNYSQLQQNFKDVEDNTIAYLDQIHPKMLEQIKEQEERRFRIEKNIDKIALNFNSDKASSLFTQNFLETKQKLRKIKNNLNNMECDTISFFEQVIQTQQKKKLNDQGY